MRSPHGSAGEEGQQRVGRNQDPPDRHTTAKYVVGENGRWSPRGFRKGSQNFALEPVWSQRTAAVQFEYARLRIPERSVAGIVCIPGTATGRGHKHRVLQRRTHPACLGDRNGRSALGLAPAGHPLELISELPSHICPPVYSAWHCLREALEPPAAGHPPELTSELQSHLCSLKPYPRGNS